MPRIIGLAKAREAIMFAKRYTAQEALEMGLANKVVPQDKLKEEVEAWCQEIISKSPTAISMLKASFNADSDSIAGIEAMSSNALWLYYQTEEALEGRRAFLEKRPPDFNKYRI